MAAQSPVEALERVRIPLATPLLRNFGRFIKPLATPTKSDFLMRSFFVIINLEVGQMFVFGDAEKTNVLLTVEELEMTVAVLGGGLFSDKLYLNALDIEKVIKRAVLSSGEIVVVLNQDKSGRDKAEAAFEFLFNRLEARPQTGRLRFL